MRLYAFGRTLGFYYNDSNLNIVYCFQRDFYFANPSPVTRLILMSFWQGPFARMGKTRIPATACPSFFQAVDNSCFKFFILPNCLKTDTCHHKTGCKFIYSSLQGSSNKPFHDCVINAL